MKDSEYIQTIESLAHRQILLDEFHEVMLPYFPDYSELNSDCFFEILLALHAPIKRVSLDTNSSGYNYITLNTHDMSLGSAKFCFVDIETTSSHIDNGQIIEIGAIITQGGKICDIFESFAYCEFVPSEITKLTGIESYMLEDAPKLCNVLSEFREFIKDSIFVAHNVSFDFNFISQSLINLNMPPLLNARLCSLNLCRRVIPSKKHALPYLDNALDMNVGVSHRALADAFGSMRLYDICLLSLPNSIASVRDIIDFSKGRLEYPKRAISNRAMTKSASKYSLNDYWV